MLASRGNDKVFLLSQYESTPDFSNLRKRRLSSLRSQARNNSIHSADFGATMEESKPSMFFPILANDDPTRRASTDWNEFISLGMQDDGNPIRSLRAKSRASRSGLGLGDSSKSGLDDSLWSSTNDPLLDSDILPPPSPTNLNFISPRRNSSRLQSLGGPQAGTGRSIYGAAPPVPEITAAIIAAAGISLPPKNSKKRKIVKDEDDSPDFDPPPTVAKKINAKKVKKPEGYVGRPPNAWILYRSEQIRILKADNTTLKKPQSDISKFIGMMWRDETQDVRKQFEVLAEVAKAEHARLHPDYKFKPVRKIKDGNAGPSIKVDEDDDSPTTSSRSRVSPKNIAIELDAPNQRASSPKKESAKSRAKSPPTQGRFHPTLPRKDFLPSLPPPQPIERNTRMDHHFREETRSQQYRPEAFPSPPTTAEEITPRPGTSINGFLASLQQDHYANQQQSERTQEDREAWAEYEASTKKWFPSAVNQEPVSRPATAEYHYEPTRTYSHQNQPNFNNWEGPRPESNYTMSYNQDPRDRSYTYTPNVGLGGWVSSDIPREEYIESNSRQDFSNFTPRSTSSHTQEEQRRIFQPQVSTGAQYNFPRPR